MYLIQDSKDLLYVVLAFCILWLTIFLAWFIYYLVMIMRQAYRIVKETREKINKVDEILKSLKEKIEHSASYLVLISDGVKKLVEVIKERSEERKEKKIKVKTKK
ncbi:MAG: hypothetical protein PHZ04_03125 [Patescibacteria group bacterium]|nr:hypothetical protein [Patescibacteria group bacterium]MDD5294753.1 hypothetical protein [Patescibacteria group bacterium]MDD5554694.1 hypothetical protein [Patescibacteria group bacterium]